MNNRLINYLASAKVELKKVNWPTKEQTLRHSIIVIGISLFVAIFLGILDFGFAKGLNFLLK